MLDRKFLKDNKELFLANMQKRCMKADYEFFESSYAQYRNLLNEQETLRSEQKKLHGKSEKADELKEALQTLIAKTDIQEKAIERWLLNQPNFLSDDVPLGETEEHNKVTFQSNHELINGTPHYDLIDNLIMKDAAVKISGARFLVLKEDLAQLQRALVSFMLEHNCAAGYKERTIPYLVKESSLYNTGQLPKFEEEAFSTNSNHWLISTGEVSLVNMFADSCLDLNEPIEVMTYSPCFRKEAGSAGRDTKGMIRLHQFHKVELVTICRPEDSEKYHQKQLNTACEILRKLDIPYRVVLICSGDTGFTASKQYDIEVWMPGLGRFVEIASCSNCADFQARRANIKYKIDGKNAFAHTLNGSSLPIERLISAIIENYYSEVDKTIKIPAALNAYMQKNSIQI